MELLKDYKDILELKEVTITNPIIVNINIIINIGFCFEFILFISLSLFFIVFYNVFFCKILYIVFMRKKKLSEIYFYSSNPIKKSTSKVIKAYILSPTIKVLKV